jgi:hypothetical protein
MLKHPFLAPETRFAVDFTVLALGIGPLAARKGAPPAGLGVSEAPRPLTAARGKGGRMRL